MKELFLDPLMMKQLSPCELTGGYTKQNCANNGGVKSVIFFNHEHLVAGTYTFDDDTTKSEIATLVLATGTQGYRVLTDKESSFATQTPTRTRDNNSYMVVQALTAMLKDDAKATQELTSILGNGFFGAVIEQENGLNRILGLNNGLTLDTEENATGQLFEDMNGSTLNFLGKELFKAPIVPDSIITTLLAPAPAPAP